MADQRWDSTESDSLIFASLPFASLREEFVLPRVTTNTQVHAKTQSGKDARERLYCGTSLVEGWVARLFPGAQMQVSRWRELR